MGRKWHMITVLLLALASPAAAQDGWPRKAVTIVVPYSAGTAPDVIARVLAEELSPRLGQPVLIDNRTGAGGLIGTEYAATAEGDGYTLLLGSLDTQAVLGHLYVKHKFDPVGAFAPISQLARIVNVIGTSPSSGIHSINDLIEGSRQGRSFTFGTPGMGTNLHVLGELIKLQGKINMVHVPYRVASTSFTDAIAGRLDLVVAGLPPFVPFLKERTLKALASSAPERVALLPDVPTFRELGYPNLVLVGWFGLLAPRAVSPSILDRLNREVSDITQLARYRSRLEAVMIDPVSTSRTDFAKLIESESARMKEVIQRANIAIE
jgi:tripartite-type tricarboxylate transporter receptor subunit TctC